MLKKYKKHIALAYLILFFSGLVIGFLIAVGMFNLTSIAIFLGCCVLAALLVWSITTLDDTDHPESL